MSSLVAKVMWVGRATIFAVGLAVIFALLFAVAYVALGTLSGNSDQTNGITQQIGSGGADQVLSVEPQARRRAVELPRGYARIEIDGDVATDRPTKGVNDVVIPTGSGQTNLYCFDLTFTPHTAVGSPFITNSADISTATAHDTATLGVGQCPAGYKDAAVRTYGSAGTPEPVNFDIVFI